MPKRQVWIDKHSHDKLFELCKAYGHRDRSGYPDVNKTINLALNVYMWYVEMLCTERMIINVSRDNRDYFIIDCDYSELALFTSGTLELPFLFGDETALLLDALEKQSGATDLSAMFIESILLLSDVTNVLKTSRRVGAIGRTKRPVYICHQPDFDSIKLTP
jgi:hypothetical protein